MLECMWQRSFRGTTSGLWMVHASWSLARKRRRKGHSQLSQPQSEEAFNCSTIGSAILKSQSPNRGLMKPDLEVTLYEVGGNLWSVT